MLRARDDGPAEILLSAGKPFALVAYLHFAPGRAATREHLTDLLWADLEPEAAKHSLRQAVWFIRQRLGAEAVRSRNGDLVLDPGLCADRDEFLRAIDTGDVERAVSFYAGDFLPAFAVPGGLEFEHWADAERVRLRLFFTRAAESLVRRKLAQGHAREARPMAQRVRDADPLSETGWRLVLETLISAGDPVSAAVEADRLEHLLAGEGRVPEPATRAMLARARHPSALPDAAQGDHGGLVAELVGREAEFATIVDVWQRAQRGPAQVLHLSAAAGLGKSRLLADVYARLRASGARAVLTRANPGERALPYTFAADLAAALASLPGAAGISRGAAAALVALNPSLSSRYAVPYDSAQGADAHRNRLLALGELAQAVAHEAPLALLVDDLHWLDPQSRELLAGAIQRRGDARVLVVTTGRPVTDGAALIENTEVLTLAPLTGEQVGVLVASLGGVPDETWGDELAERLRHATAGSPLLLLETLQLALETETLALRDARWTCADPAALDALLQAGSALTRRIEGLDRNRQWLLLLLALAGTACDLPQVASAAGRPRDAVRDDLLDLERRGLVHRAGDSWLPAHDEIATRAQEGATRDRLRAAHSGLGAALAGRADADGATLQRAGQHLAAAGDGAALASLAVRWIRRARALGDRRPSRTALRDLLGPSADPGLVRTVHQRLPLALRVNQRAAAWAAGAVIVLGLAGARVFAGGGPGTDVMLAEWRRAEDGRWQYFGLPVTERMVAEGTANLADARPLNLEATAPYRVGFRPGDGTTYLMTLDYPDSGGQEVGVGRTGGAIARLTSARGDDGHGDWSPDGRYAVIATDRWNQLSHSDLAILDITQPGAHPDTLTQDPESRHANPRWSPDGTRVAFENWTYGRRPPEICLVSVDKRDLRCVPPGGFTLSRLLGWAGPHQLAAEVVDSGGVGLIVVLDLKTLAYRVLAEGTALYPPDHPDWLVCMCRRNGGESLETRALMVDHTERAILIESAGPPPSVTVIRRPGAAPTYLDRVEIADDAGAIPLDGAFRLRIRGFDNRGGPLEVFALRWESSDTTLATIDTLGTVHPRSVGTFSVTATAGGWRSTSKRLIVAPARTETIRTDTWEDGLDQQFWRPFGEPLPTVVTSPNGGPALWHRGDSTYASGVYSRAGFDVRKGFGVEVVVSTPMTLPQWQSLTLEIESLDHSGLDRWDHRNGYVPRPYQGEWKACGGGYPGEDGAGWGRMALMAAGLARTIAVDSSAAQGASWTWRLQILPDGRCALAVNGQPLAIIDRPLPLDDSLHIVIQGWSYGTRMLVERLEAWTGVRQDIDWSVLDTR
jgi:DNA-binding SARP family transcriptional activator